MFFRGLMSRQEQPEGPVPGSCVDFSCGLSRHAIEEIEVTVVVTGRSIRWTDPNPGTPEFTSTRHPHARLLETPACLASACRCVRLSSLVVWSCPALCLSCEGSFIYLLSGRCSGA